MQHAAVFAGLLAWALSTPGAAQSGHVLLQDADLADWTTRAVYPPDGLISGEPRAIGGNPGAHYLVTHTHRSSDSAGFGLTSDTLHPDPIPIPVSPNGSRLVYELDFLVQDSLSGSSSDAEVHWYPILVQSGRTFRARDGITGFPRNFRTDSLELERERFRAVDGANPLYPILTADAPPLSLGVELQSIAVVYQGISTTRTIRIQIDNFSVRLVPPNVLGPDLWVTKDDGLETFCDAEGYCSVESPGYAIRFGNRGTRPAEAVRLSEEVPYGSYPFTFGWQCTPSDFEGQRCVYEVGTLQPGASGSKHLSIVVVPEIVREQGSFNRVTIADDGANGADVTPADNTAFDITRPAPCAGSFGEAVCCGFHLLYDTVHGQAARTTAFGVIHDSMRAFAAGVFETIDDLHLLYRVRDDVLRRTSGGRRAIDMYYANTGEISRLLAGDADLRQAALSTLGLWKPALQALVAGSGSQTITAPQLASLRGFLDQLADAASPPLRRLIERESEATGLDSFAGLTLNQGVERLNRFTCESSDQAACLNGERFRVEAEWRTPDSRSGLAQVRPMTADTTAFWFFAEENLEMLVKVLDGCAVNGAFWVFAAGLTNVEVDLAVTDTWTGEARAYKSRLNQPFQPIQDTAAFKTCAAASPDDG